MTCPKCFAATVGAYEYAGGPTVHVCPHCREQVAAAPAVMVASEDLCAEPPDAYEGPERELVEIVRRWCIDQNIRCDRIGQYRADRSGTDEGFGDLALRRPEWPSAHFVAVEVKVKGGRVRPAQRLRAERGELYICWSLRQVIEALCAEGGRGK